ncbi:MAG: alpha/beta hydrolase [Proteobacteria bacterium]|nr:alpha/beta hydrolase [Pseudomonadota bacterium]
MRAFERSATIALLGTDGEAGLALEGLFTPGPEPALAGAVIAPPHPLYGGSMDSPVVTELAHACAAAGLTSLRFNWRGVGASAGESSGNFAVADGDVRSALAFMEESLEEPLVACGYSFGAAAVLRASQGRVRVRRLLLVAPPPSILDADALCAFPGDILIVAGEADPIAPADALESLAVDLPRAQLVAIPGSDHFFMSGLTTLHQAAAGWLAR